MTNGDRRAAHPPRVTERQTREPAVGTVTGYASWSGEPVRVRFQEGVITAVEQAESTPPVWVAPGFVDLQVNGYAGFDFNAEEPALDTVAGAVRALWSRGVTTVCPTICTASEKQMLRCIAAVADARDADTDVAHAIATVHVEGPHISVEDGPRGTHPREHVRPPDVAEYERWQDASRGIVGIVTVAPEWPDAVAYIRALIEDGVLVAIGHTAATEAEIRAAVEAGASLSTHLGNGAHALIRRHPNYIWDQLAEDRLWASMVLDGRHLSRSVIRTFLRAKGIERTIAVSDAVTFAGMPPGRYEGFGTTLEMLEDGSLYVAGTEYLAGSTASLDAAIGVAMRDGGLTIDEAVRLVTSNPASLLASRLEGDRGQARVGASADLVMLRLDPQSMDVTVERTVVAGREVFDSRSQGPSVP